MPDDEGETIVVVGTRLANGTLGSVTTYSGSRHYTPREVSPDGEGGGDPPPPPIVVRISINSPANRVKAEEAARKLVSAINQALQKLESTDSDNVFTFDGRTYQVGEVLNDLLNTEFTVTDRTDFHNNGVGAASRGINGSPNTDIINFAAIVDNGYGNANYPNNSGMMALIFHELGHISSVGTNFFGFNYQYFMAKPADRRGDFYNGDYGRNVEAFANDFMNAATSAIGITPGTIPGGETGAIEPSEIYNAHSATW